MNGNRLEKLIRQEEEEEEIGGGGIGWVVKK
jgi:hypothetical protein